MSFDAQAAGNPPATGGRHAQVAPTLEIVRWLDDRHEPHLVPDARHGARRWHWKPRLRSSIARAECMRVSIGIQTQFGCYVSTPLQAP